MAIRFVTNSRVGMQRAGMVAAAVATAADRQSLDLDRLAARLRQSVSRTRAVPPDRREEFNAYLSGLRLWKRYGDLKDRGVSDEDRAEVQDLWLASADLPRATGAVTSENAAEVVQLAASMRLLRDGSFTRTDRGRALLAGLGPRIEPFEKGGLDPNPLAVGLPAQLLIASALLEADGDFFQSVWRTAEVLDADTFTRAELSLGMVNACNDLQTRARRRARTGADRATLLRAKEWATAVDRPRGSGKDWGGGRPPDQLVTLRVEPWVDLGLFTAADRFAYRYGVSDGQREVIQALSSAEDIMDLASAHLVALLHRANGRPVPRPASGDEAWTAIRTSYDKLKSTLGFAGFAEVVLLAAGSLADAAAPRLLELDDGVRLLKERRRESPKHVRIGINRAGALTYMKLSQAARTDD